jgi:hypothetical protein
MILLDNKHLMMIEPPLDKRSEKPIHDELTHIAEQVLKACTLSEHGYRGTHRTPCGMKSSNRDHYTPMGRTTNSLLAYYVQWYRNAIPEAEIDKLKQEFLAIPE